MRTNIRGVFPSARPKIVPDDFIEGSAATAAAPQDDWAREDAAVSGAAGQPTSTPGERTSRTATSAPVTAADGAPPMGGSRRDEPKIGPPAAPGGPPATVPRDAAVGMDDDAGRRPPSIWQALQQTLSDAAPLWAVLALLALFLLLAALMLIPYIEPVLSREPQPVQFAAQNSTEPPNPFKYMDDLYAFSVSDAGGESWAVVPAAPGCAGTGFALDAAGPQAQSPKHPRLQVCFLDFALSHPGKSLNEYLEERRETPMGMRVFQPDLGMIRNVEVGTARTNGSGAYLLGTEAENSQPTKWYTAIVNFEGRVYAVEAVATQEDWNTYWPKFQHFMEGITFGSGVIRPAPTLIVIE